ncbi:MAG TPA: hypothetical protein PLT63_03575 [Syntrophales bacterium]|nr:hypothetical protein [Syntrophales bacterium]
MAPQARTTQDQLEWDQFKSQIETMLKAFGTLLFLPLILLAAMAVGLREGIVAGAKASLSAIERWC